MNHKKVVRLSNVIGIVSITLLIYWVFIFITTEVFEFRVFRESITQTFYMSILGILALMVGALIINIMFNLTRIAHKHNLDAEPSVGSSNRKLRIGFILSFPIILGLLKGGDYLTSKKKEHLLIQAARSVVEDNKSKASQLVDYSYNKNWLDGMESILYLLSNTDKNFPNVAVIVRDTIDNSQVWLSFSRYIGIGIDTVQPPKKQYMLRTTKSEREYFNRVFDQNENGIRYVSNKGQYELYYPYSANGKTIILYFSDYQRYGKIGS